MKLYKEKTDIDTIFEDNCMQSWNLNNPVCKWKCKTDVSDQHNDQLVFALDFRCILYFYDIFLFPMQCKIQFKPFFQLD